MTPPRQNERLRILVVDDDELDRLAVRRCLQQSTIHARSDQVASAAEALERAAATSYDCILLDYYLPAEDGLEALRRLHETAPQSPVVIFTGRGDEDVAVELMKAGAADYLPKASLTPERLESAIRHALRVWRDAAARRRAETLLRLLSDTAEHLLMAADPDELVGGLWEKIREPLGVDAYFNVLIEQPGAPPRLASCAGLSEQAVASLLALETSSSEASDPAAAAGAVHLDHVQQSTDPRARVLRADGIRACVCHPLQAEDARLGMLCFATRGKDEFTPDELDFLRTASHYATFAYERLKHIEEMRESDRRKDEFLATLAHELRDPLAPLANIVELMKRSPDDAAVIGRARRTMERQLGQLVQLVDDLLDVARITRGRLQLRRTRVELAQALRQAAETARPLIDGARQELEIALPEEPIWLDADPVRLAQIFGNLLTNASKFTEAQGRIRVSAGQQNGEAIVEVTDTGIGIPSAELRTIFDMFAQVPSARARSQNGLGIGLTLVSRLVEMHGGTVDASSEGAGKGSQFVVRLPLSGEASEKPPPACEEAATTRSGQRVLIVDDNRDSAMSLATLLQLSGHVTREAFDGPEAIAAAREFRPDAVLLDIGLPSLDGHEVCRRLREELWGRDILIVALSGWGQSEDRRKSRAVGFDHHMVKPVKHDTLMQLLDEHAARHAAAS